MSDEKVYYVEIGVASRSFAAIIFGDEAQDDLASIIEHARSVIGYIQRGVAVTLVDSQGALTMVPGASINFIRVKETTPEALQAFRSDSKVRHVYDTLQGVLEKLAAEAEMQQKALRASLIAAEDLEFSDA